MKKEKDIATAANSKILNAVEHSMLFAAAGEIKPVINFTGTTNDFKEAGQPGNKKQVKQKNSSSRKNTIADLK